MKFDNRDSYKPGFKFAEWELKGVPLRLALGERDLDNGTIEVVRRDIEDRKEAKQIANLSKVSDLCESLLAEIQESIYKKAFDYRKENTTEVNSYEEFKEVLEGKGGFISAHWDGTDETEEKIKQETKATIRCIPLDSKLEDGVCIYSGKPSKQRVLFAKAY